MKIRAKGIVTQKDNERYDVEVEGEAIEGEIKILSVRLFYNFKTSEWFDSVKDQLKAILQKAYDGTKEVG